MIGKDETGNRYGMLTVKARYMTEEKSQGWMWICICDCGGRRIASGRDLRTSKVSSCGCLRAIAPNTTKDETGNVYGKLTVKSRHGTDRNRCATWLCTCECGKTVVASGSSLRQGNKTHCGCTRKPKVVDVQVHGIKRVGFESVRRMLFMNYRAGAVKRGLDFLLHEDEFGGLILSNCAYCGEPPERRTRKDSGKQRSEFFASGIDRVDNSRGYVSDNCVPCCTKCNRMKHTLGAVEFKEHILKIAEFINADSL